MQITNPILKGFNPDPSICRQGEDYYIATSTFEWFAGVQIHHSRDLKHWRLASRPLKRPSQLNMLGNPNSGGVWAPSLSYHGGKFWLIYTDTKVPGGAFKDCKNFLVTCDTIDGEWSEPIYLNSSGFDPSLFHDTDGRQYIINMVWDHRETKHSFYGIALQQYSNYRQRLVGKPQIIFKGTDFKATEAPQLYKIGEYYYLLTAEGGTGYGHVATIARAKNIEGPYEVNPQPLITSRFDNTNVLQKAGHASIVQTHTDEWYMVYLCGRPIMGDNKYENKYANFDSNSDLNRGYCPLGRETSIARLAWLDDWPYVEGGNSPSETVKGPNIEEQPFVRDYMIKDHFFLDKLNRHFQTLRLPLGEDICKLNVRDSHLRLYGRESLASCFIQAHVARRWQSFNFDASIACEFFPKSFQHAAGLTCYYNTENWTFLNISHDEDKGRIIDLQISDNNNFSQPLAGKEIIIPEDVRVVHLKVCVRTEVYYYCYSFDGENWHKIDVQLQTYKLSDDYVAGAGFTGAFVGMFCQDLQGQDGMGKYVYADFDYFEYKEL